MNTGRKGGGGSGTPPTVAPASRKLASGFIAGLRRGEAGRVGRDGDSGGEKAMTQLYRVMAWFR